MSIKTDITRQIVFEDLSENELEDIFRLVQAERNKRNKIPSRLDKSGRNGYYSVGKIQTLQVPGLRSAGPGE